jgi:hypothetical protein
MNLVAFNSSFTVEAININFWQSVFPILLAVVISILSLLLSFLLNRKMNKADLLKKQTETKLAEEQMEKLKQEKEKIASEIWQGLYEEVDKKLLECKKTFEEKTQVLEADNKKMTERLDLVERENNKLQKKWEKALVWVKRHSEEIRRAGIEPFPI